MKNIEYERLLDTPRGKNVSKMVETTVTTNFGVVNSITPTTDKVLRIRGFNFIPRAKVTKVELMIDGTTTGKYTQRFRFEYPPHSAMEMMNPITFDPPLRASVGVYVKAKASATQDKFKSVINAFETDE